MSYQPSFLQSERDRLIDQNDAIRESGSVAPANCWIVETEQSKGRKTYRYIRLIMATGRSRSLGRPSCESHRDWAARIQRREAIQEIEQQMRMLIELIDRQVARPISFQSDNLLHG